MASMNRNRDSQTVVLIHGLWMTGVEMFYLRRQVREAGFATENFSYRTLAGTLDDNADRLRDFLDALDGDRVHLLCHSLGGLLTLRLFERHGPRVNGRIVFMGSPVCGSQVARAMAGRMLGEAMLGRSGQEGLLPETTPEWRWPNELGVLAGKRGVGVGKALAELDEPSDGTVAVSETHIEGACDRIQLDVTHSSMLFSRPVAEQVIHFLRTGAFDHG